MISTFTSVLQSFAEICPSPQLWPPERPSEEPVLGWGKHQPHCVSSSCYFRSFFHLSSFCLPVWGITSDFFRLGDTCLCWHAGEFSFAKTKIAPFLEPYQMLSVPEVLAGWSYRGWCLGVETWSDFPEVTQKENESWDPAEIRRIGDEEAGALPLGPAGRLQAALAQKEVQHTAAIEIFLSKLNLNLRFWNTYKFNFYMLLNLWLNPHNLCFRFCTF